MEDVPSPEFTMTQFIQEWMIQGQWSWGVRKQMHYKIVYMHGFNKFFASTGYAEQQIHIGCLSAREGEMWIESERR